MHNMVRVDGSPDTVAALLCRGARSHHIVACPLRMSCKSASYCHRPAASISCMHLMPVIRCVWPITYIFNALPTRVPCEVMMGLMLGILRTHGYAWGPRSLGHVAALDPSHTRRQVWSHMTHSGTRALPGSGPGALVTWRCQSLPA
jgi:hypothetical protein